MLQSYKLTILQSYKVIKLNSKRGNMLQSTKLYYSKVTQLKSKMGPSNKEAMLQNNKVVK